LVLICSHVNAQDIFFNKVQPPDGRTFMHVTGMVQDRQGYMWLATKKGLFRSDGYQMVHFKHDPLDSTTLASDALEAITIDKEGIIWIATYGAGVLERLDPNTGRFTHYRHNPYDRQVLGPTG
jgi:ligand-binding sensor domain-containing protein